MNQSRIGNLLIVAVVWPGRARHAEALRGRSERLLAFGGGGPVGSDIRDYWLGRSWSAQPLPSGSSKKAKEFQGPPLPSTHVPSSKCRIGLIWRPRADSSAC